MTSWRNSECLKKRQCPIRARKCENGVIARREHANNCLDMYTYMTKRRWDGINGKEEIL